jgi:hypothetical protein
MACLEKVKVEIVANLKEMKACLEEAGACLESKAPTSMEIKSVAVHEEVLKKRPQSKLSEH